MPCGDVELIAGDLRASNEPNINNKSSGINNTKKKRKGRSLTQVAKVGLVRLGYQELFQPSQVASTKDTKQSQRSKLLDVDITKL